MASIVKSGGGENVTPEVTAQTPIIAEIIEGLVGKAQGANATEETIFEGYSAYVGQKLVNGKGTKSGMYVWKKYQEASYSVENPSVFITGELSTGADVASDDVDLDTLTDEFFDGFSYTAASGYSFSYIDGTLYYVANGNRNVARYNVINHTLSIPSTTGSFAGNGEFAYSGTKTWSATKFMDYVVSDNESAYPDGGTKDGYWYEKVVEGVANIDYGEITLSANQATIQVSHNLGIIPSYVILARKSGAVYDVNGYLNNNGQVTVGGYSSNIGYYTANTYFDSGTEKTSTDIIFGIPVGSSSATYYKGDYYWIAIA